MKTAIIYYSKHHENTKKLLDAIKNESSDEITLFDVTKVTSAALEEFDLVGIASGIYYSKFEKHVLEFVKNNLPVGKKTFLIYTYGVEKPGYTKAVREVLAGKVARVLGEYGCLGFNTFGPFKLIGGIAKNHPDAAELQKAAAFYNNLHKML